MGVRVVGRSCGNSLGVALSDVKKSKQQQRAEEKRQEKLDAIQEQIKDGTLKVRKMTAKERKENPPRPRPPRRGR
jgi:anti-sigma28 factor (negative regulator of flagellin synthesis)